MDDPPRNVLGQYGLKGELTYFTDGRRERFPDGLQQRAETAADFARKAGSPTPRLSLRALAALRYHTDRLELYAVANARAQRWSWGEIAESLGVTRQVLHRRYGRLFPRPRRHRPHY